MTKKTPSSIVRLFVTGFVMGSADLVPGVSGGTIALILGVYEKLVTSIKATLTQAPKLLIEGKWKQAVALVPFSFLIPLGLGLVSAVFLLSSLLTHLLQTYPIEIWSFFFGLVVASSVVVGMRVKAWQSHLYGLLLLASMISYWVVGLVPVSTPAHPVAFFFAGAIAICAMILPGVSGSFLLVVMGKYEQVLQAINDRDIVTLIAVMVGALLGLALFSKLLSYVLTKHHDATMAVLTGILIGSLRKIWPWKQLLSTQVDNHGVQLASSWQNTLPASLTGEVWLSILLAVVAAVFVLFVSQITTYDPDK